MKCFLVFGRSEGVDLTTMWYYCKPKEERFQNSDRWTVLRETWWTVFPIFQINLQIKLCFDNKTGTGIDSFCSEYALEAVISSANNVIRFVS